MAPLACTRPGAKSILTGVGTLFSGSRDTVVCSTHHSGIRLRTPWNSLRAAWEFPELGSHFMLPRDLLVFTLYLWDHRPTPITLTLCMEGSSVLELPHPQSVVCQI